MKLISIVLIVLALVVIIVPQFFTCEAHGKAIALPDGRTIPMKCLWTARAEIMSGVFLAAIGGFLFASRKLETRRILSVLAVICGIFIVLLPTTLIGVCMKPDMACVVIMKPTLLLTGIVTTALGVAATVWNFTRKPEPVCRLPETRN